MEEESTPLHKRAGANLVFAFKLLLFKQFRTNCFLDSPTQPLLTSLVAISTREDFHTPERRVLNYCDDFCQGSLVGA